MEMPTVDSVKSLLVMNEKGMVMQSIENAVTALSYDPILQGKIKGNELSGKTDIVGEVLWHRSSTSITDTDIYQIQRYVENTYSIRSERAVNKAIKIVASENTYHPIKEVLEGLVWDGKERIKHLLPKYLGADESDYTEAVMKLLMLGAISRIYEPGCKFEIMVCLVGGQGAGKSTFFRFLAMEDEWFSDDLKKLDDENIYRKLQNHWIIEMSEMSATINARSIEDIKSFISRTKDTYKVPYEVHPEDKQRQCVFVGTSNNMDFLPLDRTGNRRFAPVQIQMEKVAHHILENEDASRTYIKQAWAEAMVLYRKGNFKLKFSDEMEVYVKELQKSFMPEDTKAGIILGWLETCGKEYVCALMLFREALGHTYDEMKRWDSSEIAKIMNEVPGWEAITSHRFGGNYGIQRGWRKIKEMEDFLPIDNENDFPFH